MRVLLAWLREFAPTRLAPEELAQRLSLAGLAVDRADAVALELDLTSNRPDWLSHYGVAREIAAVCGTRLAPLPAAEVPQGACPIPVAIEDPQGCGRYCAALFEQVRIGDSAGAVAERLQQLDQRPINNVADLTNYTLWEMGHPTHAFDADTLRGGEIRVRRARPGEQLTTLDGVERTLDAADLVIADAERPIALAGVMGGEATKVTARTRRVLLESAWFDPGTVRRSARRHGLHTDASHRFERGADPEAAPLAARLIAMRMAGLKARHAGGLGDARGHRPEPQPIPLRAAMIERMLGKAVDAAESARTLENLGCRSLEAAGWLPPSWRPDLAREIDLIEEIARLHGYGGFPARLPAFAGAAATLPEAALRDRVRQQLRGRGFAETVAISFASERECARFAPDCEPVRVLNPLSQESAILRTSSLPSMLRALLENLHHGVGAPKLFEMGKTYQLAGGVPVEPRVLTLGAVGGAVDYARLKGEVEAVLAAFALPALAAERTSHAAFHPGRRARFGNFAHFGQLHPDAAREWKLPSDAWIAEIALEPLYAAGPRAIAYRPPPRYPASERDFSFLFDDAVSWAQVSGALAAPPIPLLAAISPAEVFRGPGLGRGRYSLLIRARFQSLERTLRDEEVQAGADEIIRRLRALGGTQR
ncbi:MAG TPA: phenylalanine--tRNA ligase subunit beta [Terriglobales bacterium]|nr:phenylalanine--tRNA ligase subunit beta [Terriglobales bacterium]